VDHVGSIESTFGADFYFGTSTECRYNNKTKEFVHQFSHDVQVRFGDKGDNLTFKDIVNGQEAGSAIIKFDR
jgi:hypothetical protein